PAAARAARRAAPAAPAPGAALRLLGYGLGGRAALVVARGAARPAAADAQRFRALVARRAAGEPAAYLTGTRAFYGRDFAVDARVLIPRPETEHLIEASLAALAARRAPRILDVGTGSGCIAVTLAAERSDARVVASDRWPGPLRVARANALRHGVAGRVALVRGDLTRGLRLDAFDLVASNPPYVAPSARPTLSPEVVDHEPSAALFGDDDGRGPLRRLLDAAASPRGLRPDAHLIVELGHDQGDWLVDAVARRAPRLVLADLVRDYGGHRRTAVVRRVAA
ncbi:MAG: peptide chain release factor N(5)-glutamine methyltransferase, partial [Acidobacteriota bacterium]